MTRRNVTAFLALLALTFACAGVLRAGEEASATLNVKLSVNGMHCDGCVKAVTAALKGVPGVSKAEVSLEKNEAAVTYDKGKATPEELIKAVEKAGFKCSVQKEAEKKG